MKTITVPAEAGRLNEVSGFIEEELERLNCPLKARMGIALAVEEIFVNIASYAYAPAGGQVEIGLEVAGQAEGGQGKAGQPRQALIRFQDSGRPFNPLVREDADVTLTAEEREPGGLGILLVKKNMDEVNYTHEAGKNTLTLIKRL